MLKDGNHPIWKCEKFKKMNVEERGQKARELRLCFKCFSDAHQAKNCSGRVCDVNSCGKPHHRLLHRSDKNVEQKKFENVDEVSNLSSMKSSGVLPVISVTIGSGSNFHGNSDFSSKRLRVKIGDQDGKGKENITAYSHRNVNEEIRTYNLKKLKETNPHLSVLKDSTINLGDVKVILDQDCYHLHRATEYRKCTTAKA